MSGKVYFLIAGLLTAIAVPIILNYKKQERLFEREDLTPDDTDIFNDARDFLKYARSKADRLVEAAELESTSILDEASKILSSAKERTTKLYDIITKGSKEDIMKLKQELEDEIETYKKHLS